MRSSRAGIAFDLSGIRILVEGLPEPFAARLASDWAPFAASGGAEPFLAVHVVAGSGPQPEEVFAPKAMRSALTPSSARYEMPDGHVEVSDEGTARMALDASTGSRTYYAFLNLLRAALAWRLPSRGALLIHAAGIVLERRAFLLVGAEGSGKSTWAALAQSRGALVLSDDLVLVDGGGGRSEALGAPFRSTHEAISGPGRWALASVLLPAHGPAPRLDAASSMQVRARLFANLPFVAEALQDDARVRSAVERVVTSVPAATLTFSRDAGFVDLLKDEAGHASRAT